MRMLTASHQLLRDSKETNIFLLIRGLVQQSGSFLYLLTTVPTAAGARTCLPALEHHLHRWVHHGSGGWLHVISGQHVPFTWNFSVTNYYCEMAKCVGDKHTVIISYRLMVPAFETLTAVLMAMAVPLSEEGYWCTAKSQALHPSNFILVLKNSIKWGLRDGDNFLAVLLWYHKKLNQRQKTYFVVALNVHRFC